MINTRIEIDGEIKHVELFDDMYDYVSSSGADISHYYPLHRENDNKFVVESVDIVSDPDLMTYETIEIDGEDYVRVNWGEQEKSYIKESGLGQTLWTIWQNNGKNEYYNYRSLFFETEDEAREKANELNAEVE
jgi:hypothetical protein